MGGGGWQTKGPWKLISYKVQPIHNLFSKMSKTLTPIILKMVFCIIDALSDLLQEVKGGPTYVTGFSLVVMPIFTHNILLGHLKWYMFCVNPKNVMAGEKGARKGMIKQPRRR